MNFKSNLLVILKNALNSSSFSETVSFIFRLSLFNQFLIAVFENDESNNEQTIDEIEERNSGHENVEIDLFGRCHTERLSKAAENRIVRANGEAKEDIHERVLIETRQIRDGWKRFGGGPFECY